MFEEDGKWIQMINSECKTGKTQGALVCTSTGSVESTTSFLAFYCPRAIVRGITFFLKRPLLRLVETNLDCSH